MSKGSRDIRHFIEEQARIHEFDRVGFTSAIPSRRNSFLRDWLDQGCHASMRWMEIDPEIRMDPRRFFPPAKTVVCLAVNHGAWEEGNPAEDVGGIALYARGRDYHRVIRKDLGRMADAVRDEFPHVQTRIAVDTAPVMEKSLASASGIGWIGKNSCVISRSHGSRIFLSEIFVSEELPYDQPADEMCGTCERCLDACPTKAIIRPGVIDSNLCISYLSIEHRGEIDPSLRELMGNSVFGCDICQDVCPWNRFSTPSNRPDFENRYEDSELQFENLVHLTREDFSRRFEGSPVRRAHYDGFMRNVIIALGNRGGARHLQGAIDLLDSPEPLIRGHASWAVGRLGGDGARGHLLRRLHDEEDEWVRRELVENIDVMMKEEYRK